MDTLTMRSAKATPTSRALRAGAATLFLLVAGCHGRSHGGFSTDRIDPVTVGPTGSVDDVDFAPYFAFARAIVTHAAPPSAPPPRHVGQRAFVTFWSPGQEPVRATGLGATLLDSVTSASEEVAKTAKGEGRIEIDVLTSAELTELGREVPEPVFTLGAQGYLGVDARGRIGFALPNEVLTEKLVVDYERVQQKELMVAGPRVRALLAARSGVHDVDTMSVVRFLASEHVEGARPGEAPIALYRSMPLQPVDVTAERLLGSARSAADYLARMVAPDGSFLYAYDPTLDAPSSSTDYSLLRHAGAVYALLEAYDELHVAEWLPPAERALGYVVSHLKHTPEGGAYLSDSGDNLELEKSGGVGLALLALTKYQSATRDPQYLPTMRALAEYVVRQQYPDGHFRDNADVTREGADAQAAPREKEAFFYTGEAILGLTRLYALDADPRWLAASRRAGDWIVDVRDAHLDSKHQLKDHWAAYALHDLFVLTGDDRYADHVYKIGRAIEADPPSIRAAPDLRGALLDTGDTSASATRLEAVASVIEVARYRGDDDAWLRAIATPLASWLMSEQLDPESAYLAKNPTRAIGGVRGSTIDGDVRVDFDQHALSGWLRLARELRDPTWGRR